MLILGEDFVFLEVFSESFLFFVSKELKLPQLDLKILLDVKELIFLMFTEIKLLNEVVFFLLKEVLSGVVSFWFLFKLGDEGFKFVGDFVLGVFLDGEFLAFLLEKL